MDRRTFLTSAAGAASAVALGCRPVGPDSPPITSSLAALPDPASCGIEHVVVFMMENRSFDHQGPSPLSLTSSASSVPSPRRIL